MQEEIFEENSEQIQEEAIDWQQKFNELEAKYTELEDQLKRSLADYQNLLRRSQNERQQMQTYAAEPTLLSLLPALENFHYALKSLGSENNKEQIQKSIQMIWQNLISCLGNIGFRYIEPLGETYNPLEHEAISKQAAQSEEEKGKIIEVYRPGYALKDRILKPAQVVVSE